MSWLLWLCSRDSTTKIVKGSSLASSGVKHICQALHPQVSLRQCQLCPELFRWAFKAAVWEARLGPQDQRYFWLRKGITEFWSWSCNRQHLSQSWISKLNLTFRTKSSCSSFLDLLVGSSSDSSSSSISHFTLPLGSMSSSCSSFFTPAFFLAGGYCHDKSSSWQ